MSVARRAVSLSCTGLGIVVPGRTLVADLEISVAAGECVAVLGRNGSGKTLTLRTLAGLRRPANGELTLFGRPAQSWSRPELATKISLLPQDEEDLFPSTVLETALAGRHPHLGRWQWESAEDRSIVRRELDRVGLGEFAARHVSTLSGGERRRLAIAQTLVQRPSLYLLDEPTNHLDPQHQLETLTIFREEVQRGASAIIALHDVNLAVRFSDRCLLLHGDGRWQIGPTDEVLDAKNLESLYQTAMESVEWQGRRLFIPMADENRRESV